MKHLILFFFFILMRLCASAAPRDCLIVHFTDGSYVVFPLERSPQVTFDGGVVQIADKRYQVTNVRKYTIGDSEHAGIEAINSGDTKQPYSFDGNTIVVKVGANSQKVSLHTAGGVEIPISAKPDANGFMRIPLPSHSEQVYLLTIGNETIKIRRP